MRKPTQKEYWDKSRKNLKTSNEIEQNHNHTRDIYICGMKHDPSKSNVEASFLWNYTSNSSPRRQRYEEMSPSAKNIFNNDMQYRLNLILNSPTQCTRSEKRHYPHVFEEIPKIQIHKLFVESIPPDVVSKYYELDYKQRINYESYFVEGETDVVCSVENIINNDVHFSSKIYCPEDLTEYYQIMEDLIPTPDNISESHHTKDRPILYQCVDKPIFLNDNTNMFYEVFGKEIKKNNISTFGDYVKSAIITMPFFDDYQSDAYLTIDIIDDEINIIFSNSRLYGIKSSNGYFYTNHFKCSHKLWLYHNTSHDLVDIKSPRSIDHLYSIFYDLIFDEQPGMYFQDKISDESKHQPDIILKHINEYKKNMLYYGYHLNTN